MSNLRSRTIRLAHTNPELRVHLLPLLQKTAGEMTAEGLLHFFYDVKKNLKLSGETQGVANWLHTQLGKMRFSQIQQPLKDWMYGLLKLAASLSQDASQANLWQKLHETIQRVEKELPSHRLAHVSKTATTLRNVRGLFQMVSRFSSTIDHDGQVVSVVDFMRKELLDSMYTPAILADKPLIQNLVRLDQVLLNLKDRYDYNESPNKAWNEVHTVLFKLSDQILKGVGKRVESYNAAGRYTKQTTHTYGENMSAVIRIKKYVW